MPFAMRRQQPSATESTMRDHIAEHTTSDEARAISHCAGMDALADSRTEATTTRLEWTPALVEALIRTLPIGLVVLAKDGSLVYANEVARPFWSEAHAAAAQSAFDAIIARALLAHEVVRGTVITLDPLVSAHGRELSMKRHYLVNGTPLSIAREEGDGLLITIEDVTARTEMERFRPMIESIARL
jgi:nitrogen fixation/metabolism regulation signal transduction histidine kinase